MLMCSSVPDSEGQGWRSHPITIRPILTDLRACMSLYLRSMRLAITETFQCMLMGLPSYAPLRNVQRRCICLRREGLREPAREVANPYSDPYWLRTAGEQNFMPDDGKNVQTSSSLNRRVCCDVAHVSPSSIFVENDHRLC